MFIDFIIYQSIYLILLFVIFLGKAGEAAQKGKSRNVVKNKNYEASYSIIINITISSCIAITGTLIIIAVIIVIIIDVLL